VYNLNYGRNGLDQRHNFQFTTVAELPFGRGKRWAQEGVLSKILGGWQFNALLSRYTGNAFNVTANGNSLNAPGSAQRADCIGTPIFLGDRQQWYDRSTFECVSTPTTSCKNWVYPKKRTPLAHRGYTF
jgi:hypothetical protein